MLSSDQIKEHSRGTGLYVGLVICVFVSIAVGAYFYKANRDLYHLSSIYGLCGCSAGRDIIQSYLGSRGIDCFDGGSDLGITDLHIRGSLGDLFRARKLLRKCSRESHVRVFWSADRTQPSIKWTDETIASSLTEVPPPWIQVALNDDGIESTETACVKLCEVGIPTGVIFGSQIDWIVVHPKDHAKATELLRTLKSPSLKLNNPSRGL
jgi:hypothetical protein